MRGKKKSGYIFGAALLFMLLSAGAYAFMLFVIDHMRTETARALGDILQNEHSTIHMQTLYSFVQNTEKERAELDHISFVRRGSSLFWRPLRRLPGRAEPPWK